MAAQPTITAPAPAVRPASQESLLYEEAIIGGLIGAATIAIWFLILDAIGGRPFYTPSVLGTALFRRPALASPEGVPISFEMVLLFTLVHGLVFILIGGAASWLVRLAERDPNYGFGILLFAVIHMFGFIGLSFAFAEEILHLLAWPAILGGNLLAAAAMAWYFWRRHPNLTIRP